MSDPLSVSPAPGAAETHPAEQLRPGASPAGSAGSGTGRAGDAPGQAVGHESGPTNGRPNGELEVGCTISQLRRFIKSRPYVPLHELRRRFGINGADDEVTQIDTPIGRIYVGLPAREGGLIGDLVAQGDIGYELLLDPDSPVIIGVYPMRPVTRS
jgi:hypothetical protein